MKLVASHESDASPVALADLRFILGRAMWDVGGDHAAARDHATWARDVWAKAGPGKAEDLAEAEQWLKTH